MNVVQPTSLYIEEKAKQLAKLMVSETVTDIDQLASFALLDEQIKTCGKTTLADLSDEEALAKLLA